MPGLGHAEKHPWIVSWWAEIQPLQALLRFAQLCGVGPSSQAHFKALISILHAGISAETPATCSKSITGKSPSIQLLLRQGAGGDQPHHLLSVHISNHKTLLPQAKHTDLSIQQPGFVLQEQFHKHVTPGAGA